MVTADGGVERGGRRGTGGAARWRPWATCMVLGVIFGVSLLPTAAGIRYYFCDGGDMDTLSCQVWNPRPQSKFGVLLHKHRLRVEGFFCTNVRLGFFCTKVSRTSIPCQFHSVLSNISLSLSLSLSLSIVSHTSPPPTFSPFSTPTRSSSSFHTPPPSSSPLPPIRHPHRTSQQPPLITHMLTLQPNTTGSRGYDHVHRRWDMYRGHLRRSMRQRLPPVT